MPTTLLVWRNRALGDTILAIPALRAAAASGRALRIVGYPAAWSWLGSLAPPVAEIEAAPYDALLTGSATDALAAAVRDTEAALSLSVSRDYRSVLLAAGLPRVLQRSPSPPPGVHAADHLRASLLVAFGDDAAYPLPPATPRLAENQAEAEEWLPDALRRARHQLAALGVERPIVLHPGAGYDWKCWPAVHFARLAEALVARGHALVLTQGFADDERIAAIQRTCRVPLPILRGMGLRELAAVLALARGYVGSDCGVSHLAAAVGTTTLAIFGPTDPANWAPRGPHVRVLRLCRARAQRGGLVRVCDDPECLAAVSVDAVLNTLSLMLEEVDCHEEGDRTPVSRIRLSREHRPSHAQHGGSYAL